nr:hypothetical protein HmN_000999500 [Hymenolepis microstoma]
MDRTFDQFFFERILPILIPSIGARISHLPNQPNFGRSAWPFPPAHNPPALVSQSFPILESLLDEETDVPVPASRNTAETGRQSTASLLVRNNKAPSDSKLRRALTDPTYLKHQVDILKCTNRGRTQTKERVKQWVAKYSTSEALSLKLSRAKIQLAARSVDKHLQSPCIFNRYFQGALCDCSPANAQRSSTQSEGLLSHIPRAKVPSVQSLPAIQEIFKRPKTPPPRIPRPKMARNAYSSGQSTSANTATATPSTSRSVASGEPGAAQNNSSRGLIKDLSRSQQ